VDLLEEDNLLAFNEDDLGDSPSLSRGKSTTVESKGKKGKTDDSTKPEFDFEEPEEEFDLLDDTEDEEPLEMLGNFDGLEDDPIESFDGPQPKRTSAPAVVASPIALEVAGKTPLADNYSLDVTAIDRDAVVIELPVLVAKSRVGMETAFQLQAEVFAGDVKVAEVRQTVEKASLAEFGPSFVFLKVLAPVIEREGQIKVVVKKAAQDGSGAVPLFTRTTPYALR
jgi:hypothetical protein